jgi:hypothetical protein
MGFLTGSLKKRGIFRLKVKEKAVPVLFLLTKHHAMKAYWGVKV